MDQIASTSPLESQSDSAPPSTSSNLPQIDEPIKKEKMQPVEALSTGLLAQFTSIKDLEVQLEQIANSQKALIENMSEMNDFYAQNEELMEVQLMMRKMNLYRMKLKKIRSDMLYIRSTSQNLLTKAIELQTIKVNQKAERVRRFDYEIGLIAKSKNN